MYIFVDFHTERATIVELTRPDILIIFSITSIQIYFKLSIAGYIKLRVNDGNGFIEPNTPEIITFCLTQSIPNELGLRVADFNGDGLDDLLCHDRIGAFRIMFNTFSKLFKHIQL